MPVDGPPDMAYATAQIAEQFPQEPPALHAEIARGVIDVLLDKKRSVSFKLTDGTYFDYSAKSDSRLNRARYELNHIANVETKLVLGRVNESGAHKLIEGIHARNLIWATLSEDKQAGLATMRNWTFEGYKTFLIQHDWAAAFANATDYEGGEYRLPADACLFEARINGRRIIADMSYLDGEIACFPFIELKEGWALLGTYIFDHGKLKHFYHDPDSPISDRKIIEFLGAQVRAICIGLEAEVAMTEAVRAPHKLNRARERVGKPPIFDHHIVRLANRRRLTPAEPDPNREIIHRRMHFVRGHWRHYGNHKTWIKWHLRGDPDLGFIDKEYRL